MKATTCVRLVLPLALVVGVGATLLRHRPASGRHQEATRWGEVAALHTVSGNGRPLQRPALVALDNGRALLAYVEYEIGVGDRLMVRELDRDTLDDAVAVQDRPGQILRPVAVRDGNGREQLFWTELTAQGARMFTAWRGGDGWSVPAELDTGTGPALNPECARTSDGSLWIAWQQYVEPESGRRGSFDIQVARVRDAELDPATSIASSPFNDWDPVLAWNHERLHVAWVQSTGRHYEVLARSLDLTSLELSTTSSVSQDSLADDLHPSIAAGPDGELWITWDSLYDPARGRSGTAAEPQRSIQEGAQLRLAQLRDGAMQVLPGDHSGVVPARLSWSGALPRLIAGPSNTVTVVHRYLEGGESGPSHAYPVLVQSFDGSAWSEPVSLVDSGGAPEEVAVAAADHGVWIAWQQDPRALHGGLPLSAPPTGKLKTLLESRDMCLTGRIGSSTLGVALLPAAAPVAPDQVAHLTTMTTEEQVRDHPWDDPEDDPILLGTEHFELTGDDQTYRVYWGDLHRHSSVSRCSHGMEPRPSQRYAFGRDLAMYDFYALTDHSGHISPFQWWQLGKTLDLYQTPTFCTLQGFEWSNPSFGHQNVILRERLDVIAGTRHPRSRTLELLWDLLPEGDAITIPHHSSLEGSPTDWQIHHPAYVRLVEVFQAMRGNFEFEECYRQARKGGVPDSSTQDGLQRGLKFGLIASTDHGSGASYAAVLAKELTRDSIFEALYARRTYGATTKGMLVDFRIDGHWMGEEVTTEGDPVIELHAIGIDELAEVTVFRNGEIWRRLPTRVFDRNAEHLVELVVEPGDTGPAADWLFEMTIDKGRFVKDVDGLRDPGIDPDPDQDGETASGEQPRWSQPEPRHVKYEWTAGFSAEVALPDRRLRMRARDESQIRITINGVERGVGTSELRAAPIHGQDGGLRWTLKCRVNEDKQPDFEQGLGSQEFRERWIDESCPDGNSWYYARVIQMDGEMAWSSPVFVGRE